MVICVVLKTEMSFGLSMQSFRGHGPFVRDRKVCISFFLIQAFSVGKFVWAYMYTTVSLKGWHWNCSTLVTTALSLH